MNPHGQMTPYEERIRIDELAIAGHTDGQIATLLGRSVDRAEVASARPARWPEPPAIDLWPATAWPTQYLSASSRHFSLSIVEPAAMFPGVFGVQELFG